MPELVATLATTSLTAPDFVADPYPVFAAARDEGPMHWHEDSQLWLAVGHAAASAVLRSRTLGRVWSPPSGEPMPAFALIHVNSLLENEPPTHTRLRRLVAGAFARGHVERLRPRVAELADRLADDVAAAGSDGGVVDLMPLYAEPLPVAVIAELLGVPEADRGLLRPWSNAIVKMYEYGITAQQRIDAETAAADFVAYLRDLVAERRRRPADDLISSMLAETDDVGGGRLTEDELVTTCTLLLNAGHEATVNVVGNGLTALLAHPRELARVQRDPELVPSAVEELIRYDSPLQLFERTALSDTEIGGVTVAAGTKVAALLGAANRDPAVIAEPDRLDVARDRNPHLGFGAGVHFCVGAPLARLELQASFATLLRRFPELAFASQPVRRPEFVIRGVESLPVVLGRSRT